MYNTPNIFAQVIKKLFKKLHTFSITISQKQSIPLLFLAVARNSVKLLSIFKASWNENTIKNLSFVKHLQTSM